MRDVKENFYFSERELKQFEDDPDTLASYLCIEDPSLLTIAGNYLTPYKKGPELSILRKKDFGIINEETKTDANINKTQVAFKTDAEIN